MSKPIYTPVQLLQVFNSGKPCGWLGQSRQGFWFHYASNNPAQHWVSLLMPPSQNFYQQAELFPVFAQYLPSNAGSEVSIDSPLAFLHQFNGKQLGALSFANPDNPFVKQPLRIPPPLLPGQSALIAQQTRKNIADTLVHHESVWPTVQTLQTIKKKADPQNRLQALRWALEAKCAANLVWHPRPDIDTYQQQLLGFEPLSSVLNLNKQQYWALTQQPHRLELVLAEVARTYCKNAASEIALIQQLLPLVHAGNIQVYLVYSHGSQRENAERPTVIGFEYLTAKY